MVSNADHVWLSAADLPQLIKEHVPLYHINIGEQTQLNTLYQ